MPTAPMVTARFADFITLNSHAHGMMLRFCYPPHPVAFVPREVLHGYIEKEDPVTGRPLMQELIDALTLPLSEKERHQVIAKRPRYDRLLPPDTEDNLHRLFLENAWTDGLPIVLPTEERVAEMLTGTDHDPQEVVGRMAVTTHEERFEYTVEKVAVNAVMAGARPEHLPVLLAVAASKQASMPSSTTSFISMMVVNGPIRNEIGMNCSSGALSPFNYANSVLGRTWTLMSVNLAGAKIAENFTATTGNGVNYNNMCCGENEELSVWEPLHVQHGFKPGESAVTLFMGWTVIGFGDGHAQRMAEVIKSLGMGGATFIVDPLAAKNLKNEGFDTKQKLATYLAEHGKTENARRPRPLTADRIDFVVVGGEWNPFWMTTDFHYVRTLSVDKWIPKNGIKKDARPLRMPDPMNCRDGACGLPGTVAHQ